MGEVGRDLGEVVDVLWRSGTREFTFFLIPKPQARDSARRLLACWCWWNVLLTVG